MAGSGETITHGELEARSRRLAQLLHARGLRPGDHLAVLLENHPRYFEVFWAAMRSGLYLTPINWHLKAEEAGYIVEDCGATAVVTSAALAGVAADLGPHLAGVDVRLAVDGPVPGFERYEDAVAEHAAEPLDEEVEGAWMFYSSGTTGRPKGILQPLSGAPFGSALPALATAMQLMWGFSGDTRYLCPAPLYHAAPLGWTTSVQRLGGTAVVMERFDAEEALALIERHRITHAQLVPTHFVRMLKLPEERRRAYDLSSLQLAIHAAAPCPVEVKEQMLEWWGSDRPRVLRGQRGQRAVRHRPRGVARAPGVGGPADRRHRPHPRRGGQRAPAGRAGPGVVRERDRLRVPQRPRQDGLGVQRQGVEHPRRRRVPR